MITGILKFVRISSRISNAFLSPIPVKEFKEDLLAFLKDDLKIKGIL